MDIDSQRLLDGERRHLAKAITLVESRRPEDRRKAQSLLESVLPHTGKSVRIGISGIPGVGKSTFIESLGLYLIKQGHRVAVLAVDPSSPITGGSIMGDKTRMEQLSQQPEAFIRPSPASGALGGVAQKTRESVLLCEAAGYDIILVETVGVGQSEYQVAAMVDFFLVLMQPNTGDELQGIKKGILELAHALVINKADGQQQLPAETAQRHYQNAFQLLKNSHEFWDTEVLCCSALHNRGIDAVYGCVQRYVDNAKKQNHYFERERVKQNQQWLDHLIHEAIEQRLQEDRETQVRWAECAAAVKEHKLTPYSAALRVVDGFFSG